MSRNAKLLLCCLIAAILPILYFSFRSPDNSLSSATGNAANPDRKITAVSQAAPKPATDSDPASLRALSGVSRPLQWLSDARIKGGVVVVEETPSGTVKYAGTHLLARLREDVEPDQVDQWLANEQAGQILSIRGRLVLIQPQQVTLDGFQRLRALLDENPLDLVELSEPDYIHEYAAQPNDPGLANRGAWYFNEVGAFAGWDLRTSAADIVVAVVDSGVDYQNAEFSGNLWESDGRHGYDFVDGDDDPDDEAGHGTAVAGLLGARGNNALGSSGIAWSVQLMPVRVLNEYGYGLNSDVIEGIDYAVSQGADILNLSLGTDARSTLLEDAVVAAGNAGAVLVCAGGNEGSDLGVIPFYPAGFDYDFVVQVAASNRDGQRAEFSSYSKSLVDLFAPGDAVQILAPGGADGTYLTTGSGTSFAAPLVSGVLALTMAEFPGETGAESVNRLIDAARYRPGLEHYSKSGKVVSLDRALAGYVPQIPSVTWTENPLVAEYGSRVTIAAEIQADSAYTLFWSRNGQPLGQTGETLTFSSLAPEQEGSYVLRVSSAEGSIDSVPLVVEGKPVTPKVDYLTESFTTVAGNPVRLRIRVTYPGAYTVDWFREGTADPVAMDTREYRFTVSDTSTYYARITTADTEVFSDPIQVTVTPLDWVDDLEWISSQLPQPIGYYMNSPMAADPVFWEIYPEMEWMRNPVTTVSGVYYYLSNPIRMVHIDPEGNKTVSEPLPFSDDYPFEVEGGYVTFPRIYAFKGVLSPNLEILTDARGGMNLYAIDEHDGWFYEIYKDPAASKPGLRRTRDFMTYEVLEESLSLATTTYTAYDIWAADGGILLKMHSQYLWTPEDGVQPDTISGTCFKHEDILYLEKRNTISSGVYAYDLWRLDPETSTFVYLAESTDELLLSLGQGSFRRNWWAGGSGSNAVEVFDGEDWIPVWSAIAYRYNPQFATSTSFYAVGYSENLLRSEDGFEWNYTGFALENENLVASVGDSLVLVQGTDALWLDDSGGSLQGLDFSPSGPTLPLSSVTRVGEAWFLFATTTFDNREVFISFDMVHCLKTNLPFVPVQLWQEKDGTWKAHISYQGSQAVYSSSDAINWTLGQETPPEYDSGLLEFSLGWIKDDQFSADRVNWITIPFAPSGILETSNRIFFLNSSGQYTYYLDKTDSLGTGPTNACLPYFRMDQAVLPGEPLELQLRWGGFEPDPVLKIDFLVNGEFHSTSSSSRPVFSFTPLRYVNHAVECEVSFADGRFVRYLLADLALHPRAPLVIEENLYEWLDLKAREWKGGWVALEVGRILSSEDRYSWTELVAPSALPGRPVDLRVYRDSWVLTCDGDSGFPKYISLDEGASWTPYTPQNSLDIDSIIDGQVVVSSDGYNDFYSTDPDIRQWTQFAIQPWSSSEMHVFDGYLFYTDIPDRMIRINLQSGETTVLDTNVLDIGIHGYLKDPGLPTTSVELCAFPDGDSLGLVPFGYNQFGSSGSLKLLALKEGHYSIMEQRTRFTGSTSQSSLAEEEVSFDVTEQIAKRFAHVGPQGLKIESVEALEWAFESSPVTRLTFSLNNASVIPLGSDEPLLVQLEWLDPLTGEVLGSGEASWQAFLNSEAHRPVSLEMPAPFFEDNRVLDVRLTLSGEDPSRIAGRSVYEVNGIPVKARAAVAFMQSGAGRLQVSKPGPYALGSSLQVVARPDPDFAFGHWRSTGASADPTLDLVIKSDTSVEAVFLPVEVAAADRWAYATYDGRPDWFQGADLSDIFLVDDWTHSTALGWLHTVEAGDYLYNWSPEYGWTCTRPDWYPYHWSYAGQEWVSFGRGVW